MTTVDKSTKLYSTFDPRSISDCTLWLDANDSSTITKGNGTNISSWRDKGSGGFNATNGANTGPTTTTSGNLTYLSFNGTSNFLQTTLTIPGNTHSILIVYRPSANNASSNSLLRAQAAKYIVFPYYTGGLKNSYISNFETSPGTTIDAANSPLDPSASTSVHNVVAITIASGSQAIFNNGTSRATATAALDSGLSQAFYIGAFNGVSQFYTGELAEVIIYTRAITSTERQYLEGYLAWKWGLQGNLAVGHPYISRNPNLSPFRPTDFSDCDVWFDAADRSRITGTSPVTAWANKGTISMNATQYLSQICTSGNTFNGLNYINCPAGAEMRFTCALTSQSRTWFILARCTTALITSPQNYWGPINQTVGAGQDGVVIFNNGTNFTLEEGPAGIAVRIRTQTLPTPVNTVSLYSTINSTTSSENFIGLNGTSYTLTASTAAASYNTTSVAYRINSSQYSTGADIFEIIHFNRALSTVERQNVEGYLAWKWGLQGNLPSTHPFKNFYPLKIN